MSGLESDADGGKFTLRLDEQDTERVCYAAELSSGSHGWQGTARVALHDGEVSFEGGAEATPDWLLTAARAVLREKWRAHRSAQAPWPRRITRWRARPESR